MDATFRAIGLELPSRKDFNLLVERAGDQGEPTCLQRRGAVLHGRCWKLGEGLEVWTMLYESGDGEIFYADCRPGFRARYAHSIRPWALTEYAEEGEALVHGYVSETDVQVLFELQNFTEVGLDEFRVETLYVGLCGLAYRARVRARGAAYWQQLEEHAPERAIYENDWSLCGKVLAFRELRNPLSGRQLYWVHLDLEQLRLEALVNHRSLRGTLEVGAWLEADVWLQGHVLDRRTLLSRYEGVDWACSPALFWQALRRRN
ncbi:MAG: hypothetical protein C4334_11275 [Pyrinomonas sp.]|uniref:DUF3881 family protein n=1 Tax=Pyrinomonas sp. TaxID=2080306 RepID=UPI00332592EC